MNDFFKNLFQKGIKFVKRNPTILYSLFLIVAVIAIIFFNTYYSLSKFQKNTDALLHSKAALAEDIFGIFAKEFFSEKELLQQIILEIKEKDSEIKDIDILVPTENKESFQVIASTNQEEVNQETSHELYFLAWIQNPGIAFLDHDKAGRFWHITKAIKSREGEKVALISFQVSLEEHDNFVQQSIKRVYIVALASLLIVLFLVANHVRLFGYAVRVTKLEEVDQMKDNFISMASHELRSPLTAIRGYIDLLRTDMVAEKREDEKAKQQLHYVDTVDIATKRLGDLVEELLEVSRIEQNRIPVELDSIELPSLIEGLVNEMKVRADQKGLKLAYEKTEIPLVMADPERVKQIVVNLLSNGIKYTPKGEVKVTTKEEDGFIHIVVADTGLGISPEGLKNLFSKFYRVKNKKASGIPGSGLGLWISRQLAQLMHGDLYAESIEDVGSHFILKLPVSKGKKVENKNSQEIKKN